MALTELLILGTLNNLHENHKKYSYDKLFANLNSFNGDLLALEISKDDLSMPPEELKKKYSKEIIKLKETYKELFDLRAFGIKERKDNYRSLEQLFYEDNELQRERELLEQIQKLKDQLAIDSSIGEIHNGQYDVLNTLFYKQRRLLLRESKYAKLLDYYDAEEVEVKESIINLIEKNIGKKIAIITSIDKRTRIFESIREYFGQKVLIRKV